MPVVHNKGEIREETDGGRGRPFRRKFKKPFTRKTLKYKLQMTTWSTDAPPPLPPHLLSKIAGSVHSFTKHSKPRKKSVGFFSF